MEFASKQCFFLPLNGKQLLIKLEDTHPKKLRTSAIWSAKSSTERIGHSGSIEAAPNCNSSWRKQKWEGTR